MAFVRGKSRSAARDRRHTRLRKKIVGTEAHASHGGHAVCSPRLCPGRQRRRGSHPGVGVHDGSRYAAFSGDKTAKAKKIGEMVAERAKKAGITQVVFDRGGNRYAGRVAAIADGARESGLKL